MKPKDDIMMDSEKGNELDKVQTNGNANGTEMVNINN
jgi:hypothetical protein